MQPSLSSLLGKEEAKGADEHVDVKSLEDTDFQADGEGIPTGDDVERTWYGKKQRKDGLKRSKGKDKQKHRRFARLKKLLNVGEKLKPLGLGDSGADYDGQIAARDQGQDDPHVVQSDHAVQDSSSVKEAAASNLDFAERNYDLYVQIFEARGLQGLDSNGFSDPYCKVQLGKSKQRTKTIQKCLDPQWEETFHFTARELRQCMMKSGRLVLELRDSDILSPDEFLGQAVINLTQVTLDSKGSIDWYDLKATKHGEMVTGLGTIRVGLWLANNDEEEVDPADSILQSLRSRGDRDSRCMSTLCVPRGLVKILPVVIHTEGNCLYEEPCIYYFSLQVGEVRRLSDFAGGQDEEVDEPGGFSLRRPSRAMKINKSSGSFSFDTAKSSWNMFMEEMQDSTSWLDSDDEDSGGDDDDEEEVGEDSDDDGPKDANNDDNDPFDEDEANLENPLQAPSAEDEPIASSSAPVSEKRLYVEATLGSQRRRSKIARLKYKKFSWNQGLPFATTLPVKDKKFKVMVCEMDKARQETCPIAVAFVSAHKLLNDKSEDGKWYKLHDFENETDGRPRVFGAVRLKLQGADSDGRRTLYHQPLFPQGSISVPLPGKDEDKQHTKDMNSPATRRDKNESPATDWASGAENGYDSLNEEEPAPTIRTPSFIGRLEDMAADFQRKELIVEHDRGIRRSVKLSLRALLLASQATLAICTVSIHLLLYLWKKHGRQAVQLVKNTFPHADQKSQTQDPNDETQLKAADLALGVVKIVLKEIDFHEQPKGKYFCVFKCGPHWGQTPGVRCSEGMDLNWEVQLPIIEPHTLFSICVFRDMHRKETTNLRSRPPEVIGKLRLRLNTLQAGEMYDCSLPMLGDRKKGGHHNATANLEIKMVYFFEQPVVQTYFKAAQPYDVYALQLSEGNVAKQLQFEYRRLCFEWLEHTDPKISKTVAKAVIGSHRQQFVFSRAKANWSRFIMEKERFTWIIRFWKRNQAWENPAETIFLMCCLVCFSFYPQVVLIGIILTLVFYSFVAAQKRPQKPWHMMVDPEDDDEDEAEEEGGIAQLRQKYFRLVKVALSVQNYLEDFADTLERLHAFINWADPKATLVFIFACLLASLGIAALSLPVVLSIGLCWTVRPPFLRSPTPPAPLSFFLRLPTRSDQII